MREKQINIAGIRKRASRERGRNSNGRQRYRAEEYRVSGERIISNLKSFKSQYIF